METWAWQPSHLRGNVLVIGFVGQKDPLCFRYGSDILMSDHERKEQEKEAANTVLESMSSPYLKKAMASRKATDQK